MSNSLSESYEKLVIRGSYLPHVDGIRALAVLPVLLYHLSHCLCPGGFAGVDVFFVISGYLIGGGIIRDLQAGKFSIADFYTRRVKRIMPAYFAMIVATLALGFIVYHYEPLASLGNAAYRSSYFFANFFCYKYLGGYFAGLAEAHPLLNLWSLSVEEQFYLIIPCAMLLLWFVWKRGILAIILLTALGSFIYAEVLLSNQMIPSNATKAFYLLAPRAWELLLGMALVMMPAVKLKECWSKLLAAVGLALVMASYVLLGEATTFPGMGALASTFGACLLIRYGAPGILGRVLSSRPVVGIGRISYSLYLWHWPVIVYINYFTEDSPSWWLLAFAVVLSFIISYASWKYIEMPVRRNRNISFGKAMAGLGICCVSVGIVGYTLDKSEGLVNYIHQDANKYKSLEYPRKLVPVDPEKTGIPQLSALDEKGKMVKGIVRHLGDKGVSPDFVLMGDSHADAMQIGLDDICAEKKRGQAQSVWNEED